MPSKFHEDLKASDEFKSYVVKSYINGESTVRLSKRLTKHYNKTISSQFISQLIKDTGVKLRTTYASMYDTQLGKNND
jgi:2-polyprenyl-3-methyl-5-hydroxy-6-metoxy-1,4-benzoquinol methylase